MAVGVVIPYPVFQGFDDNGDPLDGGLLYAYVAGTSTLLDTFSEVTLTTQNTNPVVLNAAGRATIYLTPATSYKLVLKTAAGVSVWSQDNVTVAAATGIVTTIIAGSGVSITSTGATAGTGDVTISVASSTGDGDQQILGVQVFS